MEANFGKTTLILIANYHIYNLEQRQKG